MLQDAKVLIESYNDLFKKGTDMYLKEARTHRPDTLESFTFDQNYEREIDNNNDNNSIGDIYRKLTEEEFYIGDEYNLYLLDNMGRKIISGSTKEIHKVFNYRDRLYAEWIETPMVKLSYITPREFFNNIKRMDILTEMFKLFSMESDYEMPHIFLQKLKIYENESTSMLIDLAIDDISSYFEKAFTVWDEKSSDIINHFTISLTAIEVLGRWKAKEAIIPLIRLLQKIPVFSHDENNINRRDKSYRRKKDDIEGYKEMYRTHIRDALVLIGDSSIQPIITILENKISYNENLEYLLMALAEIGKYNRRDRVYNLLKRAFLEMDNKIVGSSCLGVYGDGRAVAVLRGYTRENVEKLDRETFYEIKKIVEDLGGDLSDIRFPKPPSLEFH